MTTVQRARASGTRRGERILQALADEFLEHRTAAGRSQRDVAQALGISRSTYSRVETARRSNLSVIEAAQIARLLGLDLSVRVYPGPEPLRDAAQRATLTRLVAGLGPPLTCRFEVPLPASRERFEQRSWDAVIFGGGERTAVEVEMRIRDAQALERRLSLKRRDDPAERFLLVVADTRANRRIVAENPGLFADLPRMRAGRVARLLKAGRHPPSGVIFA